MKMSTHNTEQMARGYLMYQLAKRGYNVQFTDSRFPGEDLMVCSPEGKHFGIDIKGLQTKNYWLFDDVKPNPELFYAFVYVPIDDIAHVFIMTSELAMKLREDERVRLTANNPKARKHMWGLNWLTPHPYEDHYDLLPK